MTTYERIRHRAGYKHEAIFRLGVESVSVFGHGLEVRPEGYPTYTLDGCWHKTGRKCSEPQKQWKGIEVQDQKPQGSIMACDIPGCVTWKC